MAYESHHSGIITISPELNWAEIRTVGDHLTDINLIITRETANNDIGEVTLIQCDSVEPRMSYFPGYQVHEELEWLVSTFNQNHNFTGYFEMRGDEGEQWRLTALRDRIVRTEPVITWPDPEMVADQLDTDDAEQRALGQD